MEFEAWHDWQAELSRRLSATIAFFYGNFVQGACRAVVDGIEPVDRPSESIQFELFEYIYHQILRKDAAWVARDLFRERYRANAETIAWHAYDPARIGCLLLCTSRESSLDALIERPLDEGDVLSNANTVIAMGKVREVRQIPPRCTSLNIEAARAPMKSYHTTLMTAASAWVGRTVWADIMLFIPPRRRCRIVCSVLIISLGLPANVQEKKFLE